MDEKKQTRRNFAKSIAGLIAATPFVGSFASTADGQNKNDSQEETLRMLPDRPPPIVIKSGSLIVESDRGFKRRGKNATYEGTIASGVPIQSVLVNRVNEQRAGRTESTPLCDRNGFEIRIWLQAFDDRGNGQNQWIPQSFGEAPDVLIRGNLQRNQKRLEVDFPIDDSDQDTDTDRKHPLRNKKLRLNRVVVNGQKYGIFRFGKVEIRNGAGEIKYQSSPAVDGDEFVISIWNEIGDRCPSR